jgi:hypothetical protein
LRSLLKIIFSLSAVFIVAGSHAADQDDIYIEIGGGTHFQFSSELMADASIGYLPIDGVGGGIYFGQEFGTVDRFSENSGSLIGLEGRWFLEPFEVSLVLGRFFKSSDSYNFLQAGSPNNRKVFRR